MPTPVTSSRRGRTLAVSTLLSVPMDPLFIVAIIAIIAWTLTRIIQSGNQTGTEWVKAQGGEEMTALKERVRVLEGERTQWLERLENLEAIVTHDTYELDRATARLGTELPEAGGRPPLALDEPLETDTEDIPQSRRLRQR